MSLRVSEEVERYRAFVEHLRSIWSTGLRGDVVVHGKEWYALPRYYVFYGRGL